jgi:phage protein D
VGLTPTYQVLANSADITAAIASRFMSMTVTDETGITSDMLEIVLADNDPAQPIQRPKKGAELDVFLGYNGANERMGLFVVDEIEYAGWPGEMTIRARGAIFDKTPAGKANLQSQKERSWPKGTKLADMVAKIAKEHGMEPVVSASLKSIVLPHIDQASESDLNLLVRIGKNYDAIVKPSGGKLVLAKRGESKTASGKTLPTISLTPASGITRFSVLETARESSGTVVAYYHATTRIKKYFPEKDMAVAAAKAELAKRDRAKSTLSMTLPGRNDLAAECPLVLAGFRDGVDGKYIVTRVVHSVAKLGGYSTSLEAELPTEGGDPVEDEPQ